VEIEETKGECIERRDERFATCSAGQASATSTTSRVVAVASNTMERTTPPHLAVQIADALDSWTWFERFKLFPRAVFNSGLKEWSLNAE
jgi:hypothetical protein